MPHRIIWSWYTGCWWVGCYIWYSEAAAPPRGTKCNIPPINGQCTDHGPFLCGFNVPIKGLTSKLSADRNRLNYLPLDSQSDCVCSTVVILLSEYRWCCTTYSICTLTSVYNSINHLHLLRRSYVALWTSDRAAIIVYWTLSYSLQRMSAWIVGLTTWKQQANHQRKLDNTKLHSV